MNIKYALFDIYGTLATFYPLREDIQKQAAAQFGLKLTTAGITRGYLVADRMMGEQNATKPIKAMSPAEQEEFFTRFEQAVLKGDGHAVDTDTAKRIWRVVKAQNATFQWFPEVTEYLAKIKSLGIKNALISNMNYTGAQLEQDFNQPELIDFIVTSRDAGVEKPHAQIFQHSLTRAGISPNEAIYVGDQILSDVQGAQNAQIQPVLIDRHNNHPDYTASKKVTDLKELYAWLNKSNSFRSP